MKQGSVSEPFEATISPDYRDDVARAHRLVVTEEDREWSQKGYSLIQRDDDMVYQTSKWHRYLWDEHSDYSSDTERVSELGDEKKLNRWDAFMREMFTRMYSEEPGQLEKVEPEYQWAEKAHQLADELPEFEKLRDRCRGDQLWSGMAATSLSEEVLEALPEPEEPLSDTKRIQRRISGLEGLSKVGIPVENELQNAHQALQDGREQAKTYAESINDSTIRQALREAIGAANSKIEESQQMFDSFGWSLDSGGDGRGGDIKAKEELMKKVRYSRKLKKLAQLAGRMRRFAAQKQRSKADYSREEISDIITGDDISRLLPSELAKLSHPRLRMDFYRNYYEQNLLCYELKGKEREIKGPIVVCIDNSGSMGGEREIWSKAVALALLDIAKNQNRSFALLYFDTRVTLRLVWGRGKTPPDWNKVMDAMEYFSGGGTDFEPALKEAVGIIRDEEKYKKADIVFITDGQASESYAGTFKDKRKELGFTAYGILLQDGNERTLKTYCDQVLKVEDLTGPNTATDTVFAI